MAGWFAVLVPIALIALWFTSAGRKYKPIFAGEHLVELARSVQVIKDAGCRQIGEDISNPHTDERCAVSSAGIASMYTVDRAGERFVHHFSISIAGGYTPHAVGERFTLYYAGLLGLRFETLQLGVSENNVFHCEYELNDAEHAALSGMKIEVPTAEDALRQQRSCSEVRGNFRWHRTRTG